MKALERQITGILRRDEEIALGGCYAIEQLRSNCTPEALQTVQDEIRGGLIHVSERLEQIRARRRRRSQRLKARIRRNPALRSISGSHFAHLDAREQALKLQRSMFRQLGDACAWITLRGNPRRILPLYDPEQGHTLPSGIGLVGTVALVQQAHESGQFLAIENDLTRCLKLGDITVVSARSSSPFPLTVEVKSRGEFREGAIVEMDMISAHSDTREHTELYQQFCDVLGLKARHEGWYHSERAERQSTQITERTELLARLVTGIRAQLSAPSRNHWGSIEKGLSRALHSGFAYDIPESDLIFVSLGNSDGMDLKSNGRRVEHELQGLGYDLHRGELARTSTIAFTRRSEYSAVVAPIALWPLPRYLRAKLLSNELILITCFHREIWQSVFRQVGIGWREEAGSWHLSVGGECIILDPVEVSRLIAGVAFSGISPREVVEVIRKEFAAASPIQGRDHQV